VAVPAAGQRADAVRGLLPGADGCHHHPRAHPDAHRAAVGHRPRALRARDGAQPHDRPAAPADGAGAVRAGAGGPALGGAPHHRHPALARAAADLAGAGDFHPGDLSVAAQGAGLTARNTTYPKETTMRTTKRTSMKVLLTLAALAPLVLPGAVRAQ